MTQIIDATLREGSQAPGVLLTPTQTTEIARGLVEAGVDVIEVGHPLASEAEAERVRRVVELGVPVLASATSCSTIDCDPTAGST